jgi:clan AA aspartic protease
MGLTHQKLVVKSSRQSRRKAVVDFLVDSGAIYSLVSASALKKLGIQSYRRQDFNLADGTRISRRLGDAYFELNGHGGAAPVIFGERGDESLLGVTTLEALGLMLDPFKRELVPMRLVLA